MNNLSAQKHHQLDPDWVFLWFVIGGWGGLLLTGTVWERLTHPAGFAVMMILGCAFTAVGFYALISRHFWKIFVALLMLLVFIAMRM